ncbi:unnamed protein product [Medioppia subpectinata]|uniref:DUF8206 domain-containing protein n=1 Tax=Medioppia subpectinata TaxID=1979941 RepID=A0A7R9KX34_9ACAR|nr:unnamed protein product [Medioppia subpectinata]CAG2110374.1 unnamed protein product [Medioppia subpectinata]
MRSVKIKYITFLTYLNIMYEQDMNKNQSTNKNEGKKEITILLLGESGVGKSTFINAIINYMSFESMDAANERPICIIPTSFTITNPKSRRPVKVTLGDQDSNENTTDPTESATQYPKCYNFQTDKIVLNIIDTPGIADTDGVEKDNKNMKNILNFISNYKEINAFCVLLKSNEARLGVVFKYCIFQLFNHLNKSAANNIIFLFTNCRSTHYLPGESGPALIKILDKIRESPPKVDIPYDESTTYCFDNESFRYLVATSEPNNLQFDKRYKSTYVDSWDRSVEECQRLFDYIIQLTPHKVMDTLSLNNTKQMIQLLIKPLADISENIADNVNQCEKHIIEVNEYKGTIEELRKKLEIPSVEIISVQFSRPKTVCGHEECCERIVENGVTMINYKTMCHSPCYLSFGDGDIIGNKGLKRCKAFSLYSGTDRDPGEPTGSLLERLVITPIERVAEVFTESDMCRECGHSYTKHLHLLNDTKTKMTMVRDQEVDKAIESTQSAAEAKKLQITSLVKRIGEMKTENETIVKSMSIFACFLANNSLTPINDAFKQYVEHLIANEQLVPTGAHRGTAISRLEQVLQQYDEQKQLIEKVMDGSVTVTGGSAITPVEIDCRVDQLCSLKHKGHEIRTMLDQQKQAKVNHNADCNKMQFIVSSVTKVIFHKDNLGIFFIKP